MSEETNINSPDLTGKLFSVWQITLATFLGTPLAGSLLLARNYQVLGKSGAAWKSFAGGVVSTIILMLIAFWLPENFPNAVLPVAYCFGMRQLVEYLQGDVISHHLKSGGRQGSWVITVAVGLGCLVLIFVFIFALLVLLNAP